MDYPGGSLDTCRFDEKGHAELLRVPDELSQSSLALEDLVLLLLLLPFDLLAAFLEPLLDLLVGDGLSELSGAPMGSCFELELVSVDIIVTLV